MKKKTKKNDRDQKGYWGQTDTNWSQSRYLPTERDTNWAPKDSDDSNWGQSDTNWGQNDTEVKAILSGVKAIEFKQNYLKLHGQTGALITE